MSSCKIGHVNVVAQASAVGCGIVGSEDLNIGPVTVGGVEYQGNQVRLRLVVFTKVTLRIRSGRVEVTERQVLQPVRFVKPSQRALERQFRVAVGIDRILKMIFPDRNAVRHAIRCARR